MQTYVLPHTCLPPFTFLFVQPSNLNKDSNTCGDPACEGMTITIQGDILKATNVAFEGKPVNAKRLGKCEKIFKAEECAADLTPKVGLRGSGCGTECACYGSTCFLYCY